MIYLDSSALLKLLFEEDESAALESWLDHRQETPRVSSELAKAEVIRSARRLDPVAVPAARTLVSQLDLLPLSGVIVAAAADVGEPTLRTLDAIHLASALSIRADLTAFVVYDHRLAAAASAADITPSSPGLPAGERADGTLAAVPP